MPYGTVNLLHGVNPGETPVTCTAGIGTFIVEFATLSSLTGDPVFEDVARVALTRLWESRSDIGLVGPATTLPIKVKLASLAHAYTAWGSEQQIAVQLKETKGDLRSGPRLRLTTWKVDESSSSCFGTARRGA